MSATKYDQTWLIPNLIRTTGVHVVTGHLSQELAVAMHRHVASHRWEPSVLIQAQRDVSTINSLWTDKALVDLWRKHSVLIVAASPEWSHWDINHQVELCDVGLYVHDGYIYTVKGGIANARPIPFANGRWVL